MRMRRECRERYPRHQLQRKPLVNDHGMHHGTCVTHVPWCMSGSLTRGSGENVPSIPGACTTRNFTYLARGPWTTKNFLVINIHVLIITLHWLMMQCMMPHTWPVVFRKRCINKKLIRARISVSFVVANAFGGQSGSPMVDLDMELSLNVIRESREYSAKLLEIKFRMPLITDLKLSIIIFRSRKINSYWNKIKAYQKRKKKLFS